MISKASPNVAWVLYLCTCQVTPLAVFFCFALFLHKGVKSGCLIHLCVFKAFIILIVSLVCMPKHDAGWGCTYTVYKKNVFVGD